MSEFRPRPGQKEVLAYTEGKMGISAVPGSGKTRTLAELAAKLVAEQLKDDQEVLVVTLVNSAVDSFKKRINESIQERGLLPNFGYRVRTLHGLAHDIVRERPGLVGLSDDFGIVDDKAASMILDDAVDSWLRSHPDSIYLFTSPDLEGARFERIKRRDWPELVRSLAAAFIRRAKDWQVTPELLSQRLGLFDRQQSDSLGRSTLPLARLCIQIYADYQRSLSYQGAVDFEDLIRLALGALQLDSAYAARLQLRWPYVLEDEAQDSSVTQERILRLLVGTRGNWVRVGDTNQAIYETFTTADPELLRAFMREAGVSIVTLEQSGRSQQGIMDLANHLVDWTCNRHPSRFVQENAFIHQHITPTGAGDPQPNPATDLSAVRLVEPGFAPEQELLMVADSVERWFQNETARPEEEKETCAVLDPRTERATRLALILRQRGIPCTELLRSKLTTRQTAAVLGNLLRCLADPTSARKLSVAFQVWRRADREDAEAKTVMETTVARIRGCPAVEAYLWPRADHDWLASLIAELTEEELTLLTGFRKVACHWHLAATLPIDQLLLTLANDLFREPAELALAHKLAVLLRDVAAAHPTYRLTELVEELAVIARNERRFLGFASEDSGFEPPKGEVTVATMHKAKGLEWDRVYLLSLNNYDFPSGLAHDTYIAERWFIRDSLNLEAEALAQLEAIAKTLSSESSTTPDPVHSSLEAEGEATRQARLDYVAERLRLLYVGITRAKSDLFLTWNTGRRRKEKLQQAVPFLALHDYWEQ